MHVFLKYWHKSHYFFFAPFLIVVLWLSAVIPPMQSPDEPSHLVRALSIENGFILKQSDQWPHYYGSNIDVSFDSFMKSHEVIILQHNKDGNIKYTETIRLQAQRLEWGDQDIFRPAPAMAYYFPAVYIPHFISLKAGKLMGLSISETYFFSRLTVALLSFVILVGAFIIYPPPFGLLCLLSLPMTLFQFASPTIDGLTLSLSILGLSIYALLRTGERNKRLEIVMAFSILLVSLTRLHLFPLIFFILFLYSKNGSRFTLSLFTLCFLSYFLWYSSVMGLNDAVTPAGRSAANAVLEVLTNPLNFLSILVGTITDIDQLVFLLNSFIGNLGWLDAPLTSEAYITIYVLMAIVLVLQVFMASPSISCRDNLLYVIIFMLCSLIAFFALYVVNTPPGSPYIMGMQGRYFIIPLAVLFYQFSPYNNGTKLKVRISSVAAVCFLILSALITLDTVNLRYY